MKKNTTPRRKRLKRKTRLESGKKWILSYTGKNIVKGYAKWYGIDLVCAIKELKLLGVKIDENYEEKVIESLKQTALARQKIKENSDIESKEEFDEFSDENFVFIAGYTSGGAPFGLTKEEAKEMEIFSKFEKEDLKTDVDYCQQKEQKKNHEA